MREFLDDRVVALVDDDAGVDIAKRAATTTKRAATTAKRATARAKR
jgi:hypothetical protein